MSLAGSFLIAQPSLIDSNFARAVVLILAHNEEGAFGVIVNRPAPQAGLPFPVFHGGPCPAPGLFMLHGYSDWVTDTSGTTSEDEAEGEGEGGGETDSEDPKREVAPGIYLGDASCLKRASQQAQKETKVRFRAFQGYAGWGAGQLEGELSGGAWLVTPADSDVLFGTSAESLWHLLAPPRIPEPSDN
jgi:putative transcriptional regulator